MNITVDKEDLISMIRGILPHYEIHKELKSYGYWSGSKMLGEWRWNEGELIHLSEDKLFDIYNRCKDSWGND